MATWVKNQIAKQLAKFAKNLDPNSLNLKFFKGEGVLKDLELDERVISDLLEFPPWLRMSKVTCNQISAKVPWTNLKSEPLRLVLHTVDVEIAASEELRKGSQLSLNKASVKPGKYGFSEKVIDGMFVSIETLTVSFSSLGFKATVNVSRIIIQSTTPEWRQSNNLRQTRIKDDEKDEVIIFKEVTWGTMKIQVDAAYKAEAKELPSTPLRLITNNSIIRMVIKKKISDCTMVASKLAVILDDILWVLTRSQILKLSSFVHYIIKLRNKHLPLAQQTATVLQNQTETDGYGTPSPNVASQNQLFNAYDLKETSLHLRTEHVVLHLCDDTTMEQHQQHQKKQSKSIYDEPGAALQISLVNIAVDHFPYHVAGTKRVMTSKRSEDEISYQRDRWAHQLLVNFQETEGKKWVPTQRNTSASLGAKPKRPTMYESYIVAGCEDYKIMQVTTPTSSNPQPFVSCQKESLFLPKEMPAIQFDLTTYYYTTESELVPSPNIFLQVNPVQVTFDPLTCVWMNRFTQSIVAGLEWTKEFVTRESGFADHVNIRVEALMPKIVIPLKNHQEHHADERPTALQILISQAVVSNCRIGAKCSQADVLNDIQSFIGSRHYADMSCFPNEKSDLSPFSNSAWLNDYSINCHQLQNLTKRDKNLYGRLKRDHNLPRQIWCLWCDQLWMEFVGVAKSHDRPITFMDAFPIRLWYCQEVPYGDETDGSLASSSERTQSPSSCCSSIEMLEFGREADESSLSPASSVAQSPSVSHRKPSAASIRSDSGLLVNVSHTLSEQNATILSVASPMRTSHSDSNLTEHGQQTLEQNNTSGVRNIGWGGPPPPYVGNNPNMSHSLTSLPPAYDYLPEGEDPGSIIKPPLNEIDNILTAGDDQESATMALLVNITKTVQIQLDHFQLISLIRVSEVLNDMTDRISKDNATSEEEKKMGVNMDSTATLAKEEGSLVLNLAIPHVVLDLVMAPCVGIDPIQKLSWNERVQYERQVKESGAQVSCPVSSDTYRLPVRSKSRTPSLLSSRSNSLTSTPTEQRKLSPRDCSSGDRYLADPLRRNTASSPAISNQELVHRTGQQGQQSLVVESAFKEVKDVQIQVGDSLMKANLKPSGENQLVSVLRIHSDGITVGVQAKRDDLTVKLTSEGLSLNELGNMKYGHILDPRGSIIEEGQDNKQNVNMNRLTGDAMLKLRLVIGPEAEQFAAGAKDLGFADIRVTSLAAALLQSTIDNLTEFSEDECVLPVMPFTVLISCSDISIYDDKPRRSRSAIKLPPARVIIDDFTVERDSTGVVVLKNKSIASQHSINTTTTVQPSHDDAEFHPNVNGMLVDDSIHEQVDLLIGENGRLVEDLKVMNAKVNGLHVERESLLKVIEKLQRELVKSSCENDDLQMRVRSMSLSKHNNTYSKT